MNKLAIAFAVLFGLVCASPAMAQSPAASTQERDLQRTKEPVTDVDKSHVQVPHGYALIIGISRYGNLPERGQLKYAEADAQDMYTTFINPEAGAFPAQNVHRLIGADATLQNIKHELEEWLPSVSKPEDRVVVYFAGHGFVWQDRAYLAPYDVELQNIGRTAYPMDELAQVFGTKIQARWRVLLTDACHSGAILPIASDPQALNERFLKLDSSILSLTASRAREQSFEGKQWGGGHGVFTYFVKQGFSGEADANGDGIVTADELVEYVRSNVRAATNGAQTPTSDGGGNFEKNMLLAFNPTHVAAGVREAPQFGTIVLESNMDNVQAIVDDTSQGFITKDKPLRLDGLKPGVHVIKGIHMGYEPYGPERETVYPGQTTTITVRINTPVRKNKAAIDSVEKGLTAYANADYAKAITLCEHALQLDPQYSRAALCAGRAANAAHDDRDLTYYERAIAIDPDYIDARDSYAGALLERNRSQDVVRQLNVSLQADPGDGMAHYLLCVAFTRIGAADRNADALRQAVAEGQAAARYIPNKGEAHFWLAEALRLSDRWADAEPEYRRYLNLSNFDSGVGGKINYYVLGYLLGIGRKTRPTLVDIWKDQRNLAYFGLCDCERNLRRYDTAISYCQRSLTYDNGDPFAHYALGISFLGKFGSSKEPGLLIAARQHFSTVIDLNPDMKEAALARKDIAAIDQVHF